MYLINQTHSYSLSADDVKRVNILRKHSALLNRMLYFSQIADNDNNHTHYTEYRFTHRSINDLCQKMKNCFAQENGLLMWNRCIVFWLLSVAVLLSWFGWSTWGRYDSPWLYIQSRDSLIIYFVRSFWTTICTSVCLYFVSPIVSLGEYWPVWSLDYRKLSWHRRMFSKGDRNLIKKLFCLFLFYEKL